MSRLLLNKKVAIITGGSRGLGFGIAKEFIREGATVVIASRSVNAVEAAVEKLRGLGGQASGISCDIGELSQVEALSAFACAKYGKFDIWVNNGGISCPTGPTVHVPPEMVTDLIRTNINGVYHGSIVAMRHFLARESGKLINLVGKGEFRPVPLHSAYASSRAWVRNFTLAMAQEYKTTGVGIFLINPGLVETDMLQNLHFIEGYENNLKVLRVVKRLLANPPDVPARKVVWLASSATDGRTGLYTSTINPATVTKGLGREFARIILRQSPHPYDPHVELIKPALNIKIPEKSNKRGQGEYGYFYQMSDKKLPDSVGNKAMNLWLLRKRGFRVPETYILSWEAFLAYRQLGDIVLSEIRSQLSQVLDPELFYAIRSSGNIEDSQSYSFAGQFASILDVKGIDQVVEAIVEVWNETQPERLKSYFKKSQKDQPDLRMAVIIQKMVKPVVSGVAFSLNPITSLDEIMVEAVMGRGDLLVQEGATPLRWVMKWGNWIEKPEASEVWLDLIQKVADQTKKISKLYKREVDLEWVYDGENLYWVQMRDITTTVKGDIYSNRMAKEMTPGMLKPLDWSVIVPIKSAVVLDLITQVIGKNNITAFSLVKTFHYRVYHNLGTFGQIFDRLGMPRESLEIMMGVAPKSAGKSGFKPGLKFILLLPGFLRFVWDKWTFGKRAGADYSKLETEAKKYSLHPPVDSDEQRLIETIDEIGILNGKASYYAMLSIMLMQVYSGIFNSLLRKHDIDPANFDITEGFARLREYDPNEQLAALNRRFLKLSVDLQEKIRNSDYKGFELLSGIDDFRTGVHEFLERFGHMSDRTGVFDAIPWRETPDLILDLIINFKKPAEISVSRVKLKDLQLRGLHGMLLETF
jgi:NAD(P)-dependent dehydrogenase (short-subunit alcohol dehydrogenase family)